MIFASGFKVALPGINGTMSANLIVILISVVELSPAETLALGCIAAVVQTWWNKKRVAPVHVFFNLAQIAISIQLCYVVFHDSAELLGEQVPLRLMATAITYFLANTVPVAAVVSLTEQRPFLPHLGQVLFLVVSQLPRRCCRRLADHLVQRPSGLAGLGPDDPGHLRHVPLLSPLSGETRGREEPCRTDGSPALENHRGPGPRHRRQGPHHA